MQIKINYFLLITFLFSSIAYSDNVKRVTYASWDKPDVELLYVLPKKINKDTKVLFIIHGGSRNVDKYLNLWRDPAKDKNVILVAPHFTRENYQFYATLGMAKSSGDIINNEVNWLTNSIASFHTFFKSKFNLKTDTYLMFGFSGGSQFTHRYLMYGQDKAVEKAAIGSAGWYTFINNEPFPYGIKGMPLEPGRIEWMMSREILFLLGSKDNDPNHSSLNSSKGARKQGTNRLSRGWSYFNNLIRVGDSFQTPFRWRYKLIEDVDHDTKLMSRAAMPFILEDLDYTD